MSLEVFLLAIAIDIIFGEPPTRVHPVVWIGKLISFMKARARPTKADGIAVALIVILATVVTGHTIVELLGPFPILATLAAALLLKSTFAIRCLLQTSYDIGRTIDSNIDDARKMLPALVGRNTEGLSRTQATSSVIESLFENYVDSILSPLFYYVIFEPFGLGLEAALGFKAISTMDSMLGYKTKGLKEIGWAPAHLDDLANFIPARLSAVVLALAWPGRALQALTSALKYHGATPSPNSGWPMAAAAGALQLRLEKPGFYVLVERGRDPLPHDVPKAVAFAASASALTVIASALALA